MIQNEEYSEGFSELFPRTSGKYEKKNQSEDGSAPVRGKAEVKSHGLLPSEDI